MYAEIKVFAKTKVGRTSNKRYVQVMSSKDEGYYDVGGPVLSSFLLGYTNSQKGFEYGFVEITKEELCEYIRLSREALGKFMKLFSYRDPLDTSFIALDIKNNAKHKELFDEICKMFFIREQSLTYIKSMLYKLNHINDDLDFFEDVLKCIDAYEKEDGDPYILLEYY